MDYQIDDIDFSLIADIEEENRQAQLDSESRLEVELARISQSFLRKAMQKMPPNEQEKL